MRTPRTPACSILLASALLAVGCGSGSTSSVEMSAGPPAAAANPATPTGEKQAKKDGASSSRQKHPGEGGKAAHKPPPDKPSFVPRPHHDSGGGSRQFRVRGGDNSIQEFGSEASESEFGEAAAALHAYMDARAAGAWGAACERLARPVADELVRQLGAAGSGGRPGCADALAGLAASVPSAVERDAATLDAAALRVDGDSAFLLFHGAEGEEFFVPMRREDGGWKVAAIAPSALL